MFDFVVRVGIAPVFLGMVKRLPILPPNQPCCFLGPQLIGCNGGPYIE